MDFTWDDDIVNLNFTSVSELKRFLSPGQDETVLFSATSDILIVRTNQVEARTLSSAAGEETLKWISISVSIVIILFGIIFFLLRLRRGEGEYEVTVSINSGTIESQSSLSLPRSLKNDEDVYKQTKPNPSSKLQTTGGSINRSDESRQTYRRLECLDLAPLELKREMRSVPEQNRSQVEPDPESNCIKVKPFMRCSNHCLEELKGLTREDIISRSVLQTNLQTENRTGMRICNVNMERGLEGSSVHSSVDRVGEEGRKTIRVYDKNIVDLGSYIEQDGVKEVLDPSEYFIPSKCSGLVYSPSDESSELNELLKKVEETMKPYSGCVLVTEQEKFFPKIETKDSVNSVSRLLTFQTFKREDRKREKTSLPDILQPYYGRNVKC